MKIKRITKIITFNKDSPNFPLLHRVYRLCWFLCPHPLNWPNYSRISWPIFVSRSLLYSLFWSVFYWPR